MLHLSETFYSRMVLGVFGEAVFLEEHVADDRRAVYRASLVRGHILQQEPSALNICYYR